MSWKKYLSVFLGLTFIGAAFAQDTTDVNYANSFSIGVGALAKRGIKQETSTTDLTQSKKNQADYLVRLGYEYFYPEEVYGSIDFEFRGYESHNKTLSTGDSLKGSDVFFALQGRLGYVFDVGMNFYITPVIGFGIQNSRLKLESTTDFPTSDGYISRQWYFAIVGLYMDGALNDHWDLGIHLQLKPTLADPKARFNIVGQDIEKLKKKINYALDIPITYSFDDKHNALRLTPFYESQNFGVSTASAPFYTRKDAYKSYAWGGRLEYLYRF